MKIYDLTLLVHEAMAVWPGDEPPRQGWNERLQHGGDANVSHWTIGSHTGTHVDAPRHFEADGGEIADVPLERLIGPAEVLDVADEDGLVPREALAGRVPEGCTRVLLRTRNSADALNRDGFARDFVSLHPDAVEELVDAGVRTVGIDYLSVERFVADGEDYAYPVHHGLLSAQVTVLEGLDLRDIAPGSYTLVCLPLRLAGSEAAPARAVLLPASVTDAPNDPTTQETS